MASRGELEFVIPITLDALQEASTTRQYAVTNISSTKEIPRRLQECLASFRQHGSEFVCEQFDGLYSILWHFKELDIDVCDRALDLMIKSSARLTTDLASLLDDIASLDNKQRVHWLNALKMNTFLTVQLTEAFENYHNKPSQDVLLTGKGRKRGGGGGGGKSSEGWEEQRGRVLLQLYSIMQHPLHRLCTPPIMEEDYINLVSNCCYKILETPSMGLSRSKDTRDSCFQVLGTVVNRFNHGLACSLKIMQLVQHFDHLVTVCAHGLALLVTSFGCMSVLGEVVREIAKMDLGGSEGVGGGKDSATVRNYCQFLSELAELVPQALVPSLPLLFTFLDNENYTLRNCMLSMMGSLVLRVLSKEELDDKSKDLRDNCFDCLEDHLMDVNAFVRSKVVQLIHELVEANSVPLARQQRLLELTVARVMDKSAQVRKNAMSLLSAFLKQNPFAAKLPLSDLQEQLEQEQCALAVLCPESAVAEQAEEMNKQTPHHIWQEKVERVVEAVREVLNEDSDGEDYTDDQLRDDCSLNDAVSAIAVALDSGKLHRAAVLLSGALDAFNGATVLSFDPSTTPAVVASDGEDLSVDHQRHVSLLHRIFLSSHAMNTKDMPSEVEEKESEEVIKQRKLVNYIQDSVEFAKIIQIGLPMVGQLLYSKLVSDVLEAVKFFVTAFEFGVLDAMSGVRKMLVLVWSREQTVQSAVVEAYRRLYITAAEGSDRAKAQHIIQNLTALTTGATLGELASLEEIFAKFMAEGDLSKACITLLWERFTLTLSDTTESDAKTALTLLAMAANSEPSIVSSNLGILVTSGLGERGEKDFSLVKIACSALSKIATIKPKTDSATPPFRLDKEHEMFTRLSCLLVDGITRKEDRQYAPMAVQAITTIYALAEQPDVICAEIIQKLLDKMNKLCQQEKQQTEGGSDDAADADVNTVTEGGDVSLPMYVLSRFLVLVGRVALRQLVHLDTFIFSEMKRRNHLKEEHENKKKEKKTKKKNDRKKSLMTSATEASMNRGTSQDGDLDEELGLMGAVADDMEAEYIRSVCDKELLSNDNLLGKILPLVLCVCSNPSKYHEQELKAAAALALANCMMVSSDCCENNLQLLFTIMEKSDDPVIRGNTIIALGDLSFRFPNLVEPWTPRLYARLNDDCSSVRHNAITILTHLILNDMVKVKGLIADIALRITDEETKISVQAKLFFTELSRKANALYNVLPDIISRLSDPDTDLDEVKYRTIIAHIFSLLQKDKQVEGLVDKLCHRLGSSDTSRQWRDITYCLSMLQYNEKCIRKLSDLLSCYTDKLHESDVHKMFLSILAKAKKLAKPENKATIEELEAKIEESHNKGVEDENLVNKAAAATRGPKQRAGRASNVRKAGRRRPANSSSDSDFEVCKDSPIKESMNRRCSVRARVSTSKSAAASSVSDESDESDNEDESTEDEKEASMTSDEEQPPESSIEEKVESTEEAQTLVKPDRPLTTRDKSSDARPKRTARR